MKRSILFLFVLLSYSLTSFAYDFSAVASSGQTLYYSYYTYEGSVTDVKVTYPNILGSPWGSYTKPVGDLIVPDTVSYGGITYSVIRIDKQAFDYCTGLTSVTIPTSVDFIDDYAFCQCTGLTSVIIPNSVFYIGDYAFYQCTGLTSATIGSSVRTIGERAFSNCTGLTSVVFNADSCTRAGRSIGLTGFSDYGAQDYRAFRNCTNITSFTFGNNVKVIPDHLCYYLTGLTSVIIPESVTSIGRWAFHNCIGLTSVVFNADSCTYAGYYYSSNYQATLWAFKGCSNITSFTFGSNVKIIPNYLCRGLTGLTSVTIPDSVTSIGSQAFYNCMLSSITFLSPTPPSLYSGFSSVFGSLVSNYVVNIPCGSWSQYAYIIPTLHLYYMPYDYEFFAVSADDSTGSVNILTEPSCTNPNAVISAIPANGYRFDHWSTGSTDNPYTLTVTSDTTITAFFVEYIPETYTVTVLSNNTAMGGVTGGGIYEEGTSVTITAYPADGYHFDHWSTGSTDNPYTLTVTSDTTITAFFEEDSPATYTITVLVNNPATGSVTGGGVYEEGTSVTITAFPADGYRFDHWSTGSTDNPYTLTVTSDTTITAFFVEYTPETYNVTVIVDNPATGSVTGGGVYEDGSSVTIAAYPADGYHFDHWSTGSTDNPYTLTVTSDTTIIAYFVSNGGTEGIGDVEGEDIQIIVSNGCIVVEGVEPKDIQVYDITGRTVQNRALPSGVYIVKVGTLPAQKVVVMR